MPYADSVKVVGRKPVTFVEIDLDRCANVYGVSPCTATGSAGEECYNTRKTCQDAANYIRTTHTYRLVEPVSNLPIGIDAIPVVQGVTTAPTQIAPSKGLGLRETITVTMQDLEKHDRDQDPYHATRTTPATGTWFGRLFARNPYYQARTIRILTGFINDSFTWNDFQTREYLIDKMDGPSSDGKVSISAKDMLSKAYDKKAQAPIESSGLLTATLTAVDTTMTLSDGGDYTAPGYVRINEEIIGFSGSTASTLTGLTRGQWGTTAVAHAIDDTVQECLVYENENVIDIMYDLLVNYAGISASYINLSGWQAEADVWLTGLNLTRIIHKPTGVTKLLNELTDQGLNSIWWDSTTQLIELKALAPPIVDTTYTDGSHFIDGSIAVKDDPKQRVSRIFVYTNPVNWIETEKASDFSNLYVQADLGAESAEQYGEKQIRTVMSLWLNTTQAIQYASRTFNRFRDAPKLMTCKMDAASRPTLGGYVNVETRMIQSDTGASDAYQMQVLSIKDSEPGHEVTVQMQSGQFYGRYGRIAPNGLPDYSSATESQKQLYGFIAPASGTFANGDEAYKIL